MTYKPNFKEAYILANEMFNKRDKSSITEKQERKIKAVLLNCIKPFLLETLAEKIL